MKTYHVNNKDELARQLWQNVISFDTDHGSVQINNVQKDHYQVTFEVLP